jgi:hypothetical protein
MPMFNAVKSSVHLHFALNSKSISVSVNYGVYALLLLCKIINRLRTFKRCSNVVVVVVLRVLLILGNDKPHVRVSYNNADVDCGCDIIVLR